MMYKYLVKIIVMLLIIHLAFLFVGVSSKIILAFIAILIIYPLIVYIKDKFFK